MKCLLVFMKKKSSVLNLIYSKQPVLFYTLTQNRCFWSWAGGPDDLEIITQYFWKVAKTVAKPNNAKIQVMFLNSLFSWKCNKLVAKGVTNFWAISSFQKIAMSLQKVA